MVSDNINTFEILDANPNPRSNVFLMTRFRNTEQHNQITKVIQSTLRRYSLNLVRADWVRYQSELWGNVLACMQRCNYGIAIFEQLGEDRLNSPNVFFELGYMIGQGKECLLLQEKDVPFLPADLIGHLANKFDANNVQETVEVQVVSWLKQLGIAKSTDEQLLIYVSQGGTCRDPMAKAITLKLLEQNPPHYKLRVEAMGRGPLSASEASYNAQHAIANLYGENLLANHRTAVLTPTLIEEATLILVMTEALKKGLPLEKTQVLKPFFGLEGDIADPWPDSRDEAATTRYAQCAHDLQNILSQHINMLIDELRP